MCSLGSGSLYLPTDATHLESVILHKRKVQSPHIHSEGCLQREEKLRRWISRALCYFSIAGMTPSKFLLLAESPDLVWPGPRASICNLSHYCFKGRPLFPLCPTMLGNWGDMDSLVCLWQKVQPVFLWTGTWVVLEACLEGTPWWHPHRKEVCVHGGGKSQYSPLDSIPQISLGAQKPDDLTQLNELFSL